MKIAWPAAIGLALVVHAFAFVGAAKTPPKKVVPPIEMAIAMPPPPPELYRLSEITRALKTGQPVQPRDGRPLVVLARAKMPSGGPDSARRAEFKAGIGRVVGIVEAKHVLTPEERAALDAPDSGDMPIWVIIPFFAIFVGLGGGFLADAIAPMNQTADVAQATEAFIKNDQVQRIASLLSPATLYGDATSTILDPLRKTPRSFIMIGPLERLSLSRFQNPLPLMQSVVIVAPFLISLIAITFVCFGICYMVFMRQEIRST